MPSISLFIYLMRMIRVFYFLSPYGISIVVDLVIKWTLDFSVEHDTFIVFVWVFFSFTTYRFSYEDF